MTSVGLKLVLAGASLAGLIASSDCALAADWGTLSAYADVTSDYRFRGISQNGRDFAPQASVNWSGPEGFYAGVWASKINWGFTSTSVEVDIYGGKHFDLWGTDLNVEAYYYAYPDNPGAVSASYFEGIFQLSHAFGPLTLTATGAVSPDFSFETGNAFYVEGTASWAVLDWLTVSGNVGHQWVNHTLPDYTHFDIGATATWHHWALDARFNGTDLNGVGCGFYVAQSDACVGGFVAMLTYSIPDILN
jgi:uncharacterized protein (TIGR02001 family)